MRDRIPGAPGQYNATISAAEFEKLRNAEQFTITLIRDDKPLVEGTPYSKAAVLPDAVAEILCPGLEDPTPADAFMSVVQHIGIESTEYPGCYYRIVNGETEWVNPPMVTGVEYRTTERYNDKPVYTKLINAGLVPSNADKIISFGCIPFDVKAWSVGDESAYRTIPNQYVSFAVNQNGVCYLKSTGSNSDNSNAYFIIKYTKD